ncbi:hypothetical protein H8709_05030 [Oscillospiraceae bacterium NSJ-54]|uniref:Uncharacterized protein n=1 Tax=Zongyangia hominis TaxID=2763677 RepID=A0A926EBT6_9FIRM|nr:hypothetical protein [Zongyangia hominis]
MLMIATVRDVRFNSLLVRDRVTSQNVVVNTRNTRGFFPGDIVRIWYNGVMTPSIPPQIFATRITLIFSPWCCR